MYPIEMDQFSAHLDRGWDLIQRGDTRGAEVSARRALELDKEAPEVYNLLGYVAALHGDFEEAIEHYQQAIALDDTYLEAILNAAEVLIHPLGELEEAARLCDDALELAETDDERVDALLLKFDTLIGTNQTEQAKALCTRFPNGPFENPGHAFLVGRALYEVGDLSRARPLIEEATANAGASAEAFYYLGLLRDEQDDPEGAMEAFLKSLRLDAEAPRSAWALGYDTFREVVERAVAALPDQLRGVIAPNEVFVADLPGVEVVVEGVDPRALLLLDALTNPGEALEPSDDAANNQNAARARLFVYQRNVERLSPTVDVVIAELTGALQRELEAAFFPDAQS